MSGRDTGETKKAMLSPDHLHEVAAVGGDFMQLQVLLRYGCPKLRRQIARIAKTAPRLLDGHVFDSCSLELLLVDRRQMVQ